MTTRSQLAALASYLCALAVAAVDEPFRAWLCKLSDDALATMHRWLGPHHPLVRVLYDLSLDALCFHNRCVYWGPNRALNSYEHVWTEDAFDCALQIAFWETFPRRYATPDDLPF